MLNSFRNHAVDVKSGRQRRQSERGARVGRQICQAVWDTLEARRLFSSVSSTTTPDSWMSAIPGSTPLTDISVPGTTQSASGPTLQDALLGTGSSNEVNPPGPTSNGLNDAALAAQAAASAALQVVLIAGGSNQAANATSIAANAAALAAQVAAGITTDSSGAGLALGLVSDTTSLASAIASFAQVAISNSNTTADATAATDDAAVTTEDTAAGTAHTTAGTTDAAAGTADATAGTTDATSGISDATAGGADTAAGTSDTAAGVADGVAAGGDVAAGVEAGIDPVADGLAAGFDTAGAVADTAGGVADTAAGVSDGAAVTVDATAVTSDGTATGADATATTADGAADGSDAVASSANSTASGAYATAATNHTAGAASDGISAASYVAAAASDGLTAQQYGSYAAGMSSPDTTGNNTNNSAYQSIVHGLAATGAATHAAAAVSETAAGIANSVATNLNTTAASLDTAAVTALAAATAANSAALSANATAGSLDATAGSLDATAGSLDAAAGTADAAAATADAASGSLDAAAGIADGIAAAADAAAGTADSAAIALDITALATVEIPFVDIATAAAAAISDGIAAGLDATSVIADTAASVADGLATASDIAATTADATATAADTAATTGDVAATTADTAATNADTTATTLDTAAANADAAAVAACKAADAGNQAADAADAVATKVNNAATAASLASVGADIAFTAEVQTIQTTQTAVQTQSLSIADQLDSGIRSLDLRGAMVNDTINLNAGQYFTGVTLQDAMNDMTSFLQANPTETIVVSLSANEASAINSPNGFNADLNALLNSSDTSVPGTTYSDFIYSSNDPSATPDLDAVRGKIVIIPSADNSWTPTADSTTGLTIGWQPTQVTQDSHAIADSNTRWNYAVNDNGANDTGLIPTDLGNPDTLYRNNLNQDNTAAASPVAAGDTVNAIAQQYFGAVKVTRTTGIVGMDDPAGLMSGDTTETLSDGTVVDETLIDDIIDENNLPIIVTSDADTTDPGTLRTAIIQANSQPGLNTIELANTLTGTTGNTIDLGSDLPLVTNDLDVAGSATIDLNGFQGLVAASTHNVTENNYVASDSGPVSMTTSVDTTPVYLNISGLGTAIANLAKSTPAIVLVGPVDITFGTALASSQLSGSAIYFDEVTHTVVSVPGSFRYKYATGKVLHGGDGQSEAVTFVPTDTTDFKSVSGTVTVNVASATPTVTSVDTVNIAPGTALNNDQLSGTATFSINGNTVSVYGTFAYNAVGTVLAAGDGQSQAVTFTPNDTTDYGTAQSTVTVNVAKPAPAAPQITLDDVNITYGTALANDQLSGIAIISGGGTFVSVSGTYSYTSNIGSVLGAGNGQTEDVAFTPDDTTDYLTAFGTVTVNVAQATPTITSVHSVSITYGTALTGSQLNGSVSFLKNGSTVNVPGTFSYSTTTGSVLTVGNGQIEDVTFTPDDTTDYTTASSTTTVNVAKATPNVTGVNAVNIQYGTPLANGQLSGTATFTVDQNLVAVTGTFTYSSAVVGTLLNVGNGQTEAVTFTPDDSTDYKTISASVTVNVARYIPTVTVADAGGIYNGSPFPATGTATGLAGADLGTPNFTYYLSTDTTFANPSTIAPTNAGNYVAVASTVAMGNYDVGAAKISFAITPAATATTFTSSVNPAVYGQQITYSATVTNTSGTPPVPVGAVQFVVDGVNSGSPVPLNASGQAAYSINFLTGASHNVQAVYIPSPNFKNSSSASLNQVVQSIAVEGTALFVGSSGATSNDQIQINPIGSSKTGSTGVQLQTQLNGVNTNTNYSQVFSTVFIILQNGNDNVQLNNNLILSAVVTAGNGNDNIQLAAGSTNSVTLGNGNDQVTAGNGNNTVVVGSGNDNIQVGNGANVITLGPGTSNVQIQAGNGTNTVNGAASNGNDTVHLGSGNNSVTLGNGNNQVQAQPGTGNNTVVVGTGGDNINLADGNNMVSIGAGGVGAANVNNNVQLGNGNNVVTLGPGVSNVQIQAGNGTNIVNGAASNGNDTVHLGSGNNSVTLGNGNNQVQAQPGTGNNTIVVGTGGDNITLADGNNMVTVGAGGVGAANVNNNVQLGNGSNVVTLGPGASNVQIQAGDGTNTIHGAANNGNDTVHLGNGGNNSVTLGNGNDNVQIGNGSSEFVLVGNGNDNVQLGQGSLDTVTVGSGNDNLQIGDGSNNVVILPIAGNPNAKVKFGQGSNNIVKNG